MQLRAFDDRGVPGDWSPPSDLIVKLPAVTPLSPAANEVRLARRDDDETVEFKWDALPQAKSYRVDVRAARGDFKTSLTPTGNAVAAKLPVADAYVWTVVAIDQDGRDGEVVTEPNRFALRGPRLGTPRPEAPLSRYVDRVGWAAVDHAEHYETELHVFDKKTRTWTAVDGPKSVDAGEYPLDISRASGRYRLSVTAVATNRAPSKRADLTFWAEGGFTDRDRMRDAQLRDSLNKPSKYYAIASLLPSNASYQSQYAETNSRVAFTGAGVTARVGAGYQTRDSAWGGFLIADLGQTAIGGRAFTSQSAEAHATYRLNVGHRGIALVGAGAFLKQLPLIIGSPTDGFTGLGRVSEMGPHLGVTYQLPFTDRWGLRAGARVYYVGFGSTGGGALAGSVAHQAELLGTYRYGRDWTLIGGLGERHDAATWAAQPGTQSFARPGQTNTIAIDGLYLNLSVEFGF